MAELYRDAGNTFAEQATRIPADRWDRPGLGQWDVRALVGHTSRALVTVLVYLDQPATAVEVPTAERYYVEIAERQHDPAGIVERGRQAGAALGPDPGSGVADLLASVQARLATADPHALVTTAAGGMRLAPYLSTRIFELVVHGHDIARATDQEVAFSTPVLAHAAALAARIAVEQGTGPHLLAALTGRTTLPRDFSVV